MEYRQQENSRAKSGFGESAGSGNTNEKEGSDDNEERKNSSREFFGGPNTRELICAPLERGKRYRRIIVKKRSKKVMAVCGWWGL